MNIVSRCPAPPFPFPKRGHPREGRRALASDPEVIETMTRNGLELRNGGSAQRALYALLARTAGKQFDGSTVEVVDGALGVVPHGPMPADDGL
jgi:hypothetical protein